jgi:DNA-binding beta-propeller fold protein YncE
MVGLRLALVASILFLFIAVMPATAQPFEVWLVDQSNSPGLTHGGAIYIYQGDTLMGDSASSAVPAKIDLGGATTTLCFARTGANPVRPHMIFFNSTGTHAVLAFVASGHVVFFDARTRSPLACLQMSAGAGGARQAHAAFPTPDDSAVLVANQNGKLFERIASNYAGNVFVHDTAVTLNLATCTTPNGAACQAPETRPDNAPICPFVASDNGPAFVTLRGGGLFVVDHTARPMAIVGEYDKNHIAPNGCGVVEAKGRVFLNAGGGTPTNLDEFSVYRLPMTGYSALNPPNTPAPELLFADVTAEHRDAHGPVATSHEKYVWIFDRAGNVAEVFDAATGLRINTVGLLSNDSADPTPDLGVLSPSGNRIFVSLRGPNPLSGDPHASTGSTPGLGVIQVDEGGRDGRVKAIARITNPDAAGVERADAHGIALRRK